MFYKLASCKNEKTDTRRILSWCWCWCSDDNGSSETGYFLSFRHGIDMYQIITFLADTRRQLTVASRAAMLYLFIHLLYLFFRMRVSPFFLVFVSNVFQVFMLFSNGFLFKCYCSLNHLRSHLFSFFASYYFVTIYTISSIYIKLWVTLAIKTAFFI